MILFLISVSLTYMLRAERFSKSGNTRYFQHIDSHLKAYFIGFISADGCINKPTRGGSDRLSIGINIQDLALLELLKVELNSQAKITVYPKTGIVQLQISSQQLCDDLRQYGLDYRKTFNMPNMMPFIPDEYKNSFVLGVLDGDGCVYQQKRITKYKDGSSKPYYTPTIIFNGSRELLEGIQNYLNVNNQPIREIKSICEFRIQRKDAREKVFNLLYRDCPFYLTRKREKFIRIS